VVSQTTLVIQIADRQTLWERLLLYGRALLLLRDSSAKANDFLDAMVHHSALTSTVNAVRKFHLCMTHCLCEVDAMRRRVHELHAMAGAEHQSSPVEVLFEAALQYSRRAQRHEDRQHRVVALVLYRATLRLLDIVKRFAEGDTALLPRISSSISTIARRVHILSTESFSQVGAATMQDESQCIMSASEVREDSLPPASEVREDSLPPASAPIDIPRAPARQRTSTSSSFADSYGRARYCASCGLKYQKTTENYCSLCGLQRTLISSEAAYSADKNAEESKVKQ
jgi:hypothetical protein